MRRDHRPRDHPVAEWTCPQPASPRPACVPTSASAIDGAPMKTELATRFHELHADGLLLLANAWDAGTARLAQAAGARAVATSSAAVAWAHGWPDGDALPIELVLQTTRAVAGAVDVPV